jgi:hypothetical protein
MAMMNPEFFRSSMSVPAWVMASSLRGDLDHAPRCCGVAMLRGRKTVRADRRLRTDEKHIRAQSTILDKIQSQTVVAFIHNPVFRADVFFIRAEDRVGARSAQVWCLSALVAKTPNRVGDSGKNGAMHV